MKRISSKTQKAKKFYKFLKANGCLQSYITNVINYNKFNNSTKEYLEKNNIIGFLKEYDNIQSAFLWDRTKEGHKFWENINHKYYICV